MRAPETEWDRSGRMYVCVSLRVCELEKSRKISTSICMKEFSSYHFTTLHIRFVCLFYRDKFRYTWEVDGQERQWEWERSGKQCVHLIHTFIHIDAEPTNFEMTEAIFFASSCEFKCVYVCRKHNAKNYVIIVRIAILFVVTWISIRTQTAHKKPNQIVEK